jgi:hypothetical protein
MRGYRESARVSRIRKIYMSGLESTLYGSTCHPDYGLY